MKNSKAIVTIVLGAHYQEFFKKSVYDTWRVYAAENKYDLIVIEQPLDTKERAKNRSVAWQKLLILSQPWSHKYEQIVWIDADVVINNAIARNICDQVPREKVGAVETFSIPTRGIFDISIKRQMENWKASGQPVIENYTPEEFYQKRDIEAANVNGLVQTGVMVTAPSHHKSIFEHVYYAYEGKKSSDYNYEMPYLSYELLSNNQVHWISPQFNFCFNDILFAFYPWLQKDSIQFSVPFGQTKLVRTILNRLGKQVTQRNREMAFMAIFNLAYFLHFAGCSYLIGEMQYYLQKSK